MGSSECSRSLPYSFTGAGCRDSKGRAGNQPLMGSAFRWFDGFTHYLGNAKESMGLKLVPN